MKINELLGELEIFMSNEEQELLERISFDYQNIDSFTEREQTHINNMIRKSVIIRAKRDNEYVIKRNQKL